MCKRWKLGAPNDSLQRARLFLFGIAARSPCLFPSLVFRPDTKIITYSRKVLQKPDFIRLDRREGRMNLVTHPDTTEGGPGAFRAQRLVDSPTKGSTMSRSEALVLDAPCLCPWCRAVGGDPWASWGPRSPEDSPVCGVAGSGGHPYPRNRPMRFTSARPSTETTRSRPPCCRRGAT